MKNLVLSLLFVAVAANNANAVVLVNDETNMLTTQQTQDLTNQLLDIQTQTGVLVQATLIGSLHGVTINDRAYEIRRSLEQANPSVIVMLVAWTDRKAYIATSAIAKERLSDSIIHNIFQNQLVPGLKRNDIYGGFSGAARGINEQLASHPPVTYTNNLTAVTPINTTQADTTNWPVILFVTGISVFFVCLIIYMIRLTRTPKRSYTYPYSPSSYRTSSSRYNSRGYTSPRETGNTNVFAPIIMDNSTDIVSSPVSSPTRSSSSSSWSSSSSSSDWSSSDSGGGYGGSFDSGGGSGGSFDGGGGGGGDF